MVRSTLPPFCLAFRIRGGGDLATEPHVQEGLLETKFWTHFLGIQWIQTAHAPCKHTENSTMIQMVLQTLPDAWGNPGRDEPVTFVSRFGRKIQNFGIVQGPPRGILEVPQDIRGVISNL